MTNDNIFQTYNIFDNFDEQFDYMYEDKDFEISLECLATYSNSEMSGREE